MKTCPFCGSDDVGPAYPAHALGHRLVAIGCCFCGARGPVVVYPPESYPAAAAFHFADQDAELRWDRRETSSTEVPQPVLADGTNR